MKYYIFSPIVRTGSKIIFVPLSTAIRDEVGDSAHFSIAYGSNTCTLLRGGEANENHDSDILDTWENSVAVHSHSHECMPTSSSDWTFVLSSRKRKVDAALSRLVALESQVFHPLRLTNKKEDFAPFEVSQEDVTALIEEHIAKETAFVEKVTAMGGTPVVIYMEDSFTTVQEKLGKSFNEGAIVHDTNTISNLKAADYVTNYDAIQAMYDENLADYQSRFFSDTE